MKTGALFLLFLIGLIQSASAHPQDMGLLKATVENSSIDFTLELAVPVASAISGIESGQFEDASKLSHKSDLFLQTSLAESPLESSAGECKWGEATLVSDDVGKVRLRASARCPFPPSSWNLELPFLTRANRGFELLVQVQNADIHSEFVATAEDDHIIVSNEKEYPWTRFVAMGIHHIGAVPSEWWGDHGFHLPDGIDHILFVLALVLGGGRAIGILKTVTGFTLGHSITLALATLGVLRLPSRLVESAIALSIAVLAAEALFLKRTRSRWKIAFAFGLVHGLGFATALSELHLTRSSLIKALLCFNIGVEVGQAIIVSIALPILMFLQRLSYTKKWVVPVSAGLILIAGTYWFIRRSLTI